ncbi:probable glutathione S-transferase [Benincasa hispida]|uniref:probable glutathione S-transferase n=1 Tax=Benincasa hispida TaxID=102211 RepID=UPI001901EF5C|nr:probable glutathione S-transferase [Benincasa hispida]
MTEELQVFGFWSSPFSLRVELALKLKGLSYQYVEEDIANKSHLLLKYNPIYKMVPVFVHNGNPISESTIILEYIDEHWTTNPILPQHPYQRAQARFLAKCIDDKFFGAWRKAARSGREGRDKAIEEACKVLEAVENELKLDGNNKFFGGDRIGFVDIVGIFIGYWVPVMQTALGFEILSSQRFPKLSKWSEELINHSVVKEILPPKQDLFVYAQTLYRINTVGSKL